MQRPTRRSSETRPEAGEPLNFALGLNNSSPAQFKMITTIKYLAPALYLFGAVIIWYDFIHENPDGLSNIWLIVYTYPIAYFSLFIFDGQLPIFSDNYLDANALYFWPSVALISVIIFLLFYALQKFISKTPTLRSNGSRLSSTLEERNHGP